MSFYFCACAPAGLLGYVPPVQLRLNRCVRSVGVFPSRVVSPIKFGLRRVCRGTRATSSWGGTCDLYPPRLQGA